MRPRPVVLLLAVATLVAGCDDGDLLVATTGDGAPMPNGTFAWSRTLAPGATFTVLNGDGPVDVTASTGDAVEVAATASVVVAGRGTSTVSFGTQTSGAVVTVCTLYDGAQSCGASRSPRNVRVRYTVRVPRGLRVVVTTGNGDVSVTGVVASSLAATTGNGRITIVDVPGPVVATTGNGDVELRQSSARDANAELTSGNGSVTATLPAAFSGRIEATTGNGVVRSDFVVAPTGTVSGRHLSGTIGGGGPLLLMTTGNGAVTLRKG